MYAPQQKNEQNLISAPLNPGLQKKQGEDGPAGSPSPYWWRQENKKQKNPPNTQKKPKNPTGSPEVPARVVVTVTKETTQFKVTTSFGWNFLPHKRLKLWQLGVCALESACIQIYLHRWSEERCLTFLCLSFLSYKLEMKTVRISQSCF